MCIIACKPEGVEMPSVHTISNMWHNNPDGAGIMYNYEGRVHIRKGLMDLDDFIKELGHIREKVDLKSAAVVMHFRIATHGGVKPENTHPFPVSDSIPALRKTKLTTRLGVAHNGIISITPREKDISDTMEYIASQLAPLSRALPKFYENEDAMLMVSNAIDSKMAFLTDTGKIYTIGKFNESDGILYSNYGYEDYWSTWKYASYNYWDSTTGTWKESKYTPTHNVPAPYSTYSGTDDSTYDYLDDYVSPHWLMPISEVDGAYYVDVNGEQVEDEDWCIYLDEIEEPWYFDTKDYLAYKADFVAYVCNKEGLPLHYNPGLAVQMDCYDYYDEIGGVYTYDKE